ncbi:MAG: CBS domain-containing protein [Polyangiaceae bacterium]
MGFADDLTAVLAIADGDRPVYVKDGNALVGVIRLAPFAKATRVDVAMASALSVLESAGVREAVLRMARAHLREIPVVTTEGEPVGILRDVDALLALARTPRR